LGVAGGSAFLRGEAAAGAAAFDSEMPDPDPWEHLSRFLSKHVRELQLAPGPPPVDGPAGTNRPGSGMSRDDPAYNDLVAGSFGLNEDEDASKPKACSLLDLIKYLKHEICEKDLKRRAEEYERCRWRAQPAGALLKGNGLQGEAALDAYITQLVAVLRQFPYEQLGGPEHPEVGAWVRDTVVAKAFHGRWAFYANKKMRKSGFDLKSLYETLCGRNRLLDSLIYVHSKTHL